MIPVIFELWPAPVRKDDDLAAALRAAHDATRLP